ncbi:hypothetical protein KAJ27_16400, partial [bacterium]|nr:hypothetical protein [bacterium]
MKDFNRFLILFLIIVFCSNTMVFGAMKDAEEENAKGLEMLKQKKPDAARIHFQKALKQDELFVQPYFNLGLVYKMLGDKDQEIKYYYQARDKSPSDNDIKKAIYNFHLEKAREMINTGEEVEGMKILESLIPESRAPGVLYELLMNTAYKSKNFKLLRKYSKNFLLLRIKGEVGDDPEVILAHFYYAFMKQKDGNEYEAFKRYLTHGVMLLEKYNEKINKYEWKPRIQKLKSKLESENHIIQKYQDGVNKFNSKNYNGAKNIFEELSGKYSKVTKFKDYLVQSKTKIKMLALITDVTRGMMSANNMADKNDEQRKTKRKELLRIKGLLGEAISLGATGPEVENMETTIKKMIDKTENPDIVLDLSKEQFEKSMKEFAALRGSDGEEEFELHKLYLQAQKSYDDGDYKTAQMQFQELVGMIDETILGTCPSCNKINL